MRDTLVVQCCVREIQLLAGRLDNATLLDIKAALGKAIDCVPADLDPLALWTVRCVLVSAIERAQTQLDPDFGSVVHRLWHASSPSELIHEARHCVDALYESLARARRRLPRGGHVERALAYIHSHSSQPSLSLENTADHLKISRWYLSRLLVRETGMRFSQLVMKTRMERALELLLDRSLTIKEVAARVGYQYSTELDRQFKHSFGFTPTHWRAMRRQPRAIG